MTDFERDESRKFCYANDTVFKTTTYDKLQHLIIIFESSALFHAIFLSFLIICVIRFRKQKNTEDSDIKDNFSAETANIKEVQVSYRKLGRFLSLVTIKL